MTLSKVERRERALRAMPIETAARVQVALNRASHDQTMRAQRWLAHFGAYCDGQINWIKLAGVTETYLSTKKALPRISPIRTGGKFDECGIPASPNRQRRRLPPRVAPRRGSGVSTRKIATRTSWDVPTDVRYFAAFNR